MSSRCILGPCGVTHAAFVTTSDHHDGDNSPNDDHIARIGEPRFHVVINDEREARSADLIKQQRVINGPVASAAERLASGRADY